MSKPLAPTPTFRGLFPDPAVRADWGKPTDAELKYWRDRRPKPDTYEYRSLKQQAGRQIARLERELDEWRAIQRGRP
ncbi:hypothetical protein [Aquamicrobium zhengzhouense]|uniref:Uncharacterized protein n=1 Tax=Aquamicrobium zhengzhouense TaxID=2781738 RepID=A0ABS0SAL0_9HYPH|nr:hypothetical protein [Aquamicrobium zhengzhouense]MBI1620322.1 hypothetical protein [Aquamicrobium zhengzhouense]